MNEKTTMVDTITGRTVPVVDIGGFDSIEHPAAAPAPLRARSPFHEGASVKGGMRALLRADVSRERIERPPMDVGAISSRLDPTRLGRPLSCLHGLAVVSGALVARARLAAARARANAPVRSEHAALARASVASLLPEAETVRSSVVRAIRSVVGMFPETEYRVPAARVREVRMITEPLLASVTSLRDAMSAAWSDAGCVPEPRDINREKTIPSPGK